MENTKNSLIIPPAVTDDEHALEVARVWISRGDQHVSLAPLVWKDPAAWGILLSDLAVHVANAYEQAGACDAEVAIRQIVMGLNAELEEFTDRPTGTLLSEER